jgi:lipid-A-disaccharide synthase
VTRVYVVVGEASGDALAAPVVEALQRLRPDVAIRGVGGPKLRALGVEGPMRAEDLTAFGLVEALGAVARAPGVSRRILEDARRFGATVLWTVDSPDRMLRLHQKAAGMRRIHWVCPQWWAWRAWRLESLARDLHELWCLWPFEIPSLLGGGVRGRFTGHPLADVPPPAAPPEGDHPRRSLQKRIVVVPGSRPSERQGLRGLFTEVALRMRDLGHEVGWVRGPHGSPDGEFPGVAHDDVASGAAWCDAALVASGTATLEVALADRPQIVAYRVHPVTALIAGRVVQVPAVALPNLLMGRQVVPEHTGKLDAGRITAELLTLLGPAGQAQREALSGLRNHLKGPGAVALAQALIGGGS